MRDSFVRGKGPFVEQGSRSVDAGSRRIDPVRFGAPTPEPPESGADDGRAGAAPGGSGFRDAILRERSAASRAPDPAGQRAGGWSVRPKPGTEPDDEEERRWLHTWQANEIRWLSSKVEGLERRLRRSRIVAVGAVMLGGFAVVYAFGSQMASPPPPGAVVAEIETTSDGSPTAAAPTAAPAAGEPHQAPQAPAAPAGPTPATPPTAEPPDRATGASPAPAMAGPLTTEQPAAGEPDPVPEASAAQAGPTPPPAAPRGGEPDRVTETASGESESTSVGSGAASVDAGPATVEPEVTPLLPELEPESAPSVASREAEAERALMAIIEPPPSPAPAADAPEGVPTVAPAEAPGATEVARPPAGAAGRSPSDATTSSATTSADGTADGAEYYTSTDFVNLRDGPASAAAVVTVVAEGERLRWLGSVGDWMLVEYGARDDAVLTGWVHSRFLRPVEGGPPNGATSLPARS